MYDFRSDGQGVFLSTDTVVVGEPPHLDISTNNRNSLKRELAAGS